MMYKTVSTLEEMIAISQGKTTEGNVKRVRYEAPKKDTFVDFGCRKPAIPEGSWPFEIVDAYIERNCDTKYGKRDRVVIVYGLQIESGDDAPDKTAELKQKYLVSNHPTSQFATLILALTGRAIGKGIELSNLIGIRGLAEVMHNTNANSDTFANITELSDIVQVEQSLVSGCI